MLATFSSTSRQPDEPAPLGHGIAISCACRPVAPPAPPARLRAVSPASVYSVTAARWNRSAAVTTGFSMLLQGASAAIDSWWVAPIASWGERPRASQNGTTGSDSHGVDYVTQSEKTRSAELQAKGAGR